jgi:hypothetical protein
VEEPAGTSEAWTAEQAVELLAAMANQQEAEDEPQNEQTCVHGDP